jgi:hypothetical protein
MLRDKRFWAGVIVGYLLLVVFPQANIRSLAAKKPG